MNIAWLTLIAAGVFEIGWPLGLKNATGENGVQWFWIIFALVSMTISGVLLFQAQKTIPIGTAYAVWTGIGAVGTFLVGISFFGDHLNAMRAVSIMLIIGGVIGLKLA